MSEWQQPGSAQGKLSAQACFHPHFSYFRPCWQQLQFWCPRNVHTGSAHCLCGTVTFPVLVVELCLHSQLCVNGLPGFWTMFSETSVSTGAGSVGMCFFLEATKLGLSPVRSSVPATSNQTMSRSLVSAALGTNLRVPQPLLLPGHSRKWQNPRNQSRC